MPGRKREVKRALRGKLPKKYLIDVVLRKLGARRGDVRLGAGYGEDAAILDADGKIVVATTDPLTGSGRRLGWLSVHINANDVATRGAAPRWFLSTILLPPPLHLEALKEICGQIDSAAKELKVSVVGGHSEVTASVSRPMVVGAMIGVVEKGGAVKTAGAKPGDAILMTKSAAVEGTAILAVERREVAARILGARELRKAAGMLRQVSVVPEALAAHSTGRVHAMHDPTEGGLAGGLHELADASRVGFRVYEEAIPISPATRKICEAFGIDPLRLISSGTLLIAVGRRHVGEVIDSITRCGVQVSRIGEAVPNPRLREIVRADGRREPLPCPAVDELWRALEGE